MSITALVFLVCYGIGILAALFRHPIFGLYTYLWAFYVSPSSHWWGKWAIHLAPAHIISSGQRFLLAISR